MNIRRVCILALVALLSVGNLMAQRGGLRVGGIAPAFCAPVITPGFGEPLPVPFGVASTFGFPAAQMPFIVNSGGFGGFGVAPGFGPLVFGAVPQVIVPGQVS